jgi:hypothetical protein
MIKSSFYLMTIVMSGKNSKQIPIHSGGDDILLFLIPPLADTQLSYCAS